jgi:opacity protein-like surface antigen
MRYLIAAAAMLSASQALAQDNGWNFRIAPYLWLPDTTIGVTTPRGSVSAELPIDKALENLKFAFMGTFEANRGKWTIATDLVYFNLAATKSTPFGGLFDHATVSSQITAVTALAMYRVHETSNTSVELGAGLRAWSLSTETVLSGGALPTETSTADDDWIDPVIALRGKVDFNEKWFGTLYLDGGGFGSGSDGSYQAIATVGYNVNDKWALIGGWRYLDFTRKINGNDLDFQQSGLVLGASYSF